VTLLKRQRDRHLRAHAQLSERVLREAISRRSLDATAKGGPFARCRRLFHAPTTMRLGGPTAWSLSGCRITDGRAQFKSAPSDRGRSNSRPRTHSPRQRGN
jgi:hypothetical protein